MHTFRRICARSLSTGAMTTILGALAVTLASSASAHVTVSSTDATRGGFGKITVRVPNESASAGTTRVSVSLPADWPLAHVSVKPHAGWSISAPKVSLARPVEQGDVTITEAVSTVIWTADPGVSIKPGEFDEFEFSAGRLPSDRASMSFPAVQTYSDGKVVRWDEAPGQGPTEPEHPAPMLNLLPPKASGHSPAASVMSQKTAGSDPLARGMGASALVVTAGGVGLGFRRKRVARG